LDTSASLSVSAATAVALRRSEHRAVVRAPRAESQAYGVAVRGVARDVIVRDRGVIRHTYLFDTLGHGEPGGEFIEETQTSVHGPHPGFAETSRSATSRPS